MVLMHRRAFPAQVVAVELSARALALKLEVRPEQSRWMQ